ncbi:hypothetical protein AP460_02757 [Actinobacillus pleuropneumoniae]|uniref:Uncharacterized protein n=1 Tax=Actinobacillus pleuropneumoniae serotype 3 (strain JL03) TaxID=434271 RepID=B0BPP8_ACTPJ|nr:hypothetical protein [Actinobacillus pleuropneumoniae]ABY69533.1 hypothetical protein APJL_0975 [Actinobacillus pleuropneumoniae serovar 3 str. JL03]KIE91096.1 hypothetical protein AP518_02866 [Actinobacillus pleuropneumoniae]KIE91400.1 hypothetical protein AP1022_02773 [Actinobacillus pleuropneumoniae]KIE91560.1 hypothetical protein AP460_02757 [Actinobacillus pleuropneumoniae]KIE96671.1 hypothetical protein AP5651_02873 [Actinobacillus pleuropneumoniae]
MYGIHKDTGLPLTDNLDRICTKISLEGFEIGDNGFPIIVGIENQKNWMNVMDLV